MTTRIIYFKNTSGTHFKDYKITWDQITHDVTIAYGKISGSKNTMVEHFPDETSASNFVMEKCGRRLGHDYVLDSDEVIGISPAAPVRFTKSRNEFARDLVEMRLAEQRTG